MTECRYLDIHCCQSPFSLKTDGGRKLCLNRMSAIGFYCDVAKVKGKEGEDRIVVSFNGKYLPHVEQVGGPRT